jgi:DNA-directed RNA polymerase specialized sigma24 family protein
MRSHDVDDTFGEFVAARGQALLQTAYLRVGNRHDAEDLLQTVLARTYAAWAKLDAIEAAESYVRVALARAATGWWRRRKREVPVAYVPDKATVPVDAAVSGDEMWTSLKAIPRGSARFWCCAPTRTCPRRRSRPLSDAAQAL